MELRDISTCVQDWEDLKKEFNVFEALNKDYLEKFEALGELQDKCVKEWNHQSYRLNLITRAVNKLQKDKNHAGDSQLQELSKNVERRLAHLREIEQTLPKQSNGLYLKIILGNVNVSILNKNDKFRYKDEYEKFKLVLSVIGLVLSVLNLIVMWRPLELAFMFLLVWYYCTLTIRESILKVNGSRIKGWWRLHHFISTFAAGVLLIWPNAAPWYIFRNQFMWFNCYITFVQYLQFRYQQGVLYRLKALGERHNMDITIEGFHSWMWRGLSFLLPFLFAGYVFQFYNAVTLYKLISHQEATWQVPVLCATFLTLFLGNTITTCMVIPQKFSKKLTFSLPSYCCNWAHVAGSMRICADCGKTGPSWASMNRGILLCDECCSVHRNIGRHISWVRSLHHGWWSPSLLMMVETLNKAGANNVWEHTLLEHGTSTTNCKPAPTDPVHSKKEDFIRGKHEDLEFVLKTDQETDGVEGLGAQLHAAARTPDLVTSLRLFSQGADPNFFHEEKGSTPLHVAAKSGQLLQAELLIIHGADLTRKDSSGKTPEECALETGHSSLAERLKECKYHVIDRLLQYLCSRKAGQSNQLDVLRNEVLTSLELSENNTEARMKLQLLPNNQFEKLVADVYDEVDRREAENALLLSNPTKSLSTTSSTPFLPVHPELSSTRNQGRQKLARLSNRELNALIYDILQDSKRRDTTTQPFGLEEPKKSLPQTVQQSPALSNRLRSEISDEEPLYDSVASDEDYAYAEKMPPPVATPSAIQNEKESSEGELRKSLATSQATINRLQSEIRILEDTVAGLMKENRELRDEILRSRSFSRGMETSGEGEAEPVSDNRGQRSTRPTSMYETREGLRYWAPKNEENRGGTQSLYHRQSYFPDLPRYEDVLRRTDQVTKRIQELWTAMKESEHRTFVPCAERIRVAVAELIAIFAQSPPDELIRELGVSTARLQIECAALQDCRPSIRPDCLQQVRNCAYDIAKATKLIVMKCQNIS